MSDIVERLRGAAAKPNGWAILGADAATEAAAEIESLRSRLEADFEIYHQVYMVLLNAGTDKYLGALEQAQALVARAENAEAALVETASDLDAACRGHDAAHAACVKYDERLAAANALLREIRDTVRRADLHNGGAPENGLWTLPDRIDAHLAEDA